MLNVVRLTVTILALVTIAGVAEAQGVELLSGQKVVDSLTEPGELRMFRFHAPGETLLNLTITPSKKTSLAPVVNLLGPEGRIGLPPLVKGKLKVKKLELPHTGLYLLTITGGGTTGDYKLVFKLKLQKKGSGTFTVPDVIDVDIVRGTLMSVTVNAVKGSSVEPGFDSVIDPTGSDILDPDLVTEKGGKAAIKKQLCTVFGRHDISVVARSATGGDAKVTVKLKLPKTEVKKLGPNDLIDAGLFKLRRGDDEFAFLAWAENGVKDARLEHPDGSVEILPEPETGEFELLRYFATESELDTAFSDGVYTLVITRHDGLVLEYPVHVRGGWPGKPEITDEGTGNTPTVVWQLGNGDPTQVFLMQIVDSDTDDDLYQVLFPGTDRSHAVPSGTIDGEPYETEIWSISPDLKVSVSGGDGNGGTVGEVLSAEGTVASVTRSSAGPPVNSFYLLEARLEGNEIKDVDLRLPSGATLQMDLDGGEWEYSEFDEDAYPDGTYTFVVTFTDDVVDESNSFQVGGAFPRFQGRLTPDDGDMDAGTTPLIAWPTDPGDSGYQLVVEDSTESSVIEKEYTGSSTGSYQVQSGELVSARWYFATISMDTGQGKSAVQYATFYTGDLGRLFWNPYHVRGREGSGPISEYGFYCYVFADEIDSATLVKPDGSEIDLTDYGEEFETWFDYASETALLNAIPHGLYTLKLVMSNGSECPFLYQYVGGAWPDFASVTAPTDGAVGVSRTPTFNWTYGDKSAVAVLEIELEDDPTGDDQVDAKFSDLNITSVIWDDLDWTNGMQLDASTEFLLGLITESNLNKLSERGTSFTTGQ